MKTVYSIFSVKYITVLALFCLTAISFLPQFSSVVLETEQSNPLSKYIVFLAAIVFCINFDYKTISACSYLRSNVKWVIVIALVSLVPWLLDITSEYFDETRAIIMTLMFFCIGYTFTFSEIGISILIVIYSATMAFSNYLQIVDNFGGFVIEGIYMQYGKNLIGEINACSSVALLFVFLFCKEKRIGLCALFLSLFVLFLTITIRARASFLCIFAIYGYLLYKAMNRQSDTAFNIRHLIIPVCLVVLVVLLYKLDTIWDYIYSSFTLNHESDLTSGRNDRNLFAINVVRESPLLGNLSLRLKYEWVHNYFLRQLSSYGLIGAFPLLFYYLKHSCFVVKHCFESKCGFANIGYFVSLIPIIISLEEPTFPFAPGTGVLLSFFLLGYSVRQSE